MSSTKQRIDSLHARIRSELSRRLFCIQSKQSRACPTLGPDASENSCMFRLLYVLNDCGHGLRFVAPSDDLIRVKEHWCQ